MQVQFYMVNCCVNIGFVDIHFTIYENEIAGQDSSIKCYDLLRNSCHELSKSRGFGQKKKRWPPMCSVSVCQEIKKSRTGQVNVLFLYFNHNVKGPGQTQVKLICNTPSNAI